MPSASVTYQPQNGDPSDVTQINTNFSDLVTFLNTYVVQKDGSVAFTGIPTLPGSDPTSNNQATRKLYVDNKVSTSVDAVKPQTVRVYATVAARNAAITSPTEGMTAYTSDTDTFWYYNGSAWAAFAAGGAWTSWTPTWSNITLGTGGSTNTGSYVQLGKTVHFRARFTIGNTGSSVSGDVILTLPVNAKTPAQLNGQAVATDSSGAGDFFLQPIITNTSQCQFRALNTAGTYAAHALISPTVPFGWSPGDTLTVDGTYEAA